MPRCQPVLNNWLVAHVVFTPGPLIGSLEGTWREGRRWKWAKHIRGGRSEPAAAAWFRNLEAAALMRQGKTKGPVSLAAANLIGDLLLGLAGASQSGGGTAKEPISLAVAKLMGEEALEPAVAGQIRTDAAKEPVSLALNGLIREAAPGQAGELRIREGNAKELAGAALAGLVGEEMQAGQVGAGKAKEPVVWQQPNWWKRLRARAKEA